MKEFFSHQDLAYFFARILNMVMCCGIGFDMLVFLLFQNGSTPRRTNRDLRQNISISALTNIKKFPPQFTD